MNNRMKELRLKFGYTQVQMAKKLNITVSMYNMIENGKRGISLQLAKSVSDIFHTSIEEIFFSS